jgi:thymidine kinase
MITIIVGPMYSGKTSRAMLLSSKKKYRKMINNKPRTIVYIMHSEDNRYSENSILKTHSGFFTKSIKTSKITEIIKITEKMDIICIDEGHFFMNIVEIAKKLKNNGKDIIITLLNSDYRKKIFQHTIELFSISDKIIFCRGTCSMCDKKSSFTKMINNKNSTKMILKSAGKEMFIPVCSKHFS